MPPVPSPRRCPFRFWSRIVGNPAGVPLCFLGFPLLLHWAACTHAHASARSACSSPAPLSDSVLTRVRFCFFAGSKCMLNRRFRRFWFFFGGVFLGFLSRVAGIASLGLGQGRCGWFMHEGGHGSLTGNLLADVSLQVVFYGTGCGMSAAFWRNQHNKHHATPQKVDHDVDLDTLPLVMYGQTSTSGLTISHAFLSSTAPPTRFRRVTCPASSRAHACRMLIGADRRLIGG